MIFGGVFMVLALAFPDQKIKWLQPSKFFLQIAVCNVILGVPFLTSTPERIYTLTPVALLIAITAEEALRTGAFFWVLNTFKNKYIALVMAAMTFAAMHMFYSSLSEWAYAFYGGFVLSGCMVAFKSQLAGVVSHWTYDLASLAWISPLWYFIISGACGLFGLILRRG
jgi:membrane protease YdiL (CAAX protease family)